MILKLITLTACSLMGHTPIRSASMRKPMKAFLSFSRVVLSVPVPVPFASRSQDFRHGRGKVGGVGDRTCKPETEQLTARIEPIE